VKLLQKRSDRLLLLALASGIAFLLHASGILTMDVLQPLSPSGCAAKATRATIPAHIGELPPVDHMGLAKHTRSGTDMRRVERGEVLEITYTLENEESGWVGPVTFLGVDPETRTLGVLTESGDKQAIPARDIKEITRVIENRPAGAVLFPTLGAVGGAGTGFTVGAIASGDPGGGGIPAACIGGPALFTGLGIGLGRAGFDHDYEIDEDEWQIVIPAVSLEPTAEPEPPPETIPAPAPEAEPDAGSETKTDAGPETGADAGAGVEPEADAGPAEDRIPDGV
jgi:hypothetical protein